MIAIDTNVLLRYLLQDDPKQSGKAGSLINGEEDVLVTNVVLAETLWTLCGKKYNATQSNVVSTIQALFEEPKIIFEDPKTVWKALDDYVKSNGKNDKKIDFQDALILNRAKNMRSSAQKDYLDFIPLTREHSDCLGRWLSESLTNIVRGH